MQTSNLAPPPAPHDDLRRSLVLAHHTPLLPSRMLEPPGLQWGTLTRDDGAQLRWCCLKPPRPWAEAIIALGFSEFIEKYFETMRDLADQGIAVWCFDWRGQGLSDRRGDNPARATPRDFTRDMHDLVAFTAHIGPKLTPRILIAHSMGGAIGLHTLLAEPTLFDTAIFSAPMIAVSTGPFPRWMGRLIARAGVRLGFGGALIPGLNRMAADAEVQTGHSVTSHDPIRCTLMQQWFRAKPLLKIDGVSFGWYDSAIAISQTFSDLTLYKSIQVPVLFGAAGQDVFVETTPIRNLAHMLPHATMMNFPAAKHELFHERDDIRGPWLEAIFAFLRANSTRSRP